MLFQSNGQSSNLQRLGDAGFDLFMVDKLAAISLLNRFVDVGVELLVLFNQTQSSLLDQLLGRSAGVIGYLRKPRFLFGCELYFHALGLGSHRPPVKKRTFLRDASTHI